MSKNRYAVTCNGRAAFYASMYEDIRTLAMELGWAVALHGSLKSDMDIMAMPWVENATRFETLISAICGLFENNELAEQYSVDYKNKPHGRIVATIPIWADFYLDISTVDGHPAVERIHGEWIVASSINGFAKWDECSECGYDLNYVGQAKTMEMNFCPNCGCDMRTSTE